MRLDILTALDEAVASGARLHKACEAINICERRVRRWRNSPEDERRGGYRAKSQKLTLSEVQSIFTNFHSEDLIGQPVRVAHAKLMDKGTYIASPATCIRVLNSIKPVANKATSDKIIRNKPELKASEPCKIWCWDITWLPSNVRGKYFYLYLIIDLYSRLIIDWTIHTTEDGVFARQLFANAFTEYNIDEHSLLLVHADNGQTMRSVTLNELFKKLSVNASHSRPHTSNDNAFAESIFATMKGRILYPEHFMSIEGAIEFVEKFVEWYNFEHKHSELEYLSPFEVHEGMSKELLYERNALLENNRIVNPSRHGGRKKVYRLPDNVELKHKVSLKAVS
jgi:putative transposase